MQEAGLGHWTASLASSTGRELFDDPSYVNVQHLDKARHAGAGAGTPGLAVNGSVPRDLFDMSECRCSPCVPEIPSVPPAPSFGPPPGRPWGLGLLCQPPLLALFVPQSLLKMPFGRLPRRTRWPWPSSSGGSPGSMGS